MHIVFEARRKGLNPYSSLSLAALMGKIKVR
jgi:hypothetical protein